MLQENKRPKIFWLILSAFLLVPTIVSVVSTIHVINFFQLSNYYTLALTLAIAFEIGALSALAGLVALDKINKNVVYFIFILLTAYQMMGNTYFAYDFMSQKMASNPDLIKNWTELFGFSNEIEDIITVKRIIAIISGAILPVVSLCFLDLSVDYIQKSTGIQLNKIVSKDKVVDKALSTELESKPEINQESLDSTLKEIEENIKEERDIAIENYKKQDEDNDSFKKIATEEKKENEESSILPDPIMDIDDFEDSNFDGFLEDKRKKLESLKAPYLKLLMILYKGGELYEKSELPSYTDFLDMVSKDEYSPRDIKRFLTLCNYLGIFKVSGTQKIALKSYGEAINTINGYLSWN